MVRDGTRELRGRLIFFAHLSENAHRNLSVGSSTIPAPIALMGIATSQSMVGRPVH